VHCFSVNYHSFILGGLARGLFKIMHLSKIHSLFGFILFNLFLTMVPGYAGQIDYWAPGTIRPDQGTIEMDVKFRAPREVLATDWKFLFRALGNRVNGGTTSMAIVFCSPRESRDLAAIVRGSYNSSLNVATPEYEVGKTIRIALTWEQGEMALWWDGARLERQIFKGGNEHLPEKFEAGVDVENGYSTAFEILDLRISDTARNPVNLRRIEALDMDDSTTFLKAANDTTGKLGLTTWQANHSDGFLFPSRKETSFLTTVGAALPVTLRGVNFSASTATYDVKTVVRNRQGETVAESSKRQINVPSSSKYEPFVFTMPVINQSGYYESDITIVSASGKAIDHRLNFVVQPIDNGQPGQLSDYLGHHFTVYKHAGYQSVRAWAWHRVFLWSSLEPVPGEFQWGASDRFMEEVEALDMDALAVLGYPPAWASTYSPAERERLGIPAKGKFANSSDRYQPRNIEEWKNYVRAVVTRYKGRVKYWEIYNEVDFHPPAMQASFSGSTEDYFELLKTAYEVIKSVDPEAQVMPAGFSLLRGVTDTEMPLDLLKMGAAQYFDIFAIHGYTDSETAETTVQAARAAKPAVPLWMTEYMFSKEDDAQFLPEQALNFLAKGFARYFLHGGELDRNFGKLAITPYYAVAAELSRQIGKSDQYLGAVPGAGQGYQTWNLRRADGLFLHVFSVRNGKLSVTFKPVSRNAKFQATNAYGDTIAQGAWDSSKPFEFENLVYLLCSDQLEIDHVDRAHENALINPGFEIREGDFSMNEAAARPSFWELRPRGLSSRCMSFVPGLTGDYALRLDSPDSRALVRQDVVLDLTGNWEFSAKVRATRGSKVSMRFSRNTNSGWIQQINERIVGTGEWETIKVVKYLEQTIGDAGVTIGLDEPGGVLDIDDVKVIFVKD
jgi:hypothetical protein